MKKWNILIFEKGFSCTWLKSLSDCTIISKRVVHYQPLILVFRWQMFSRLYHETKICILCESREQNWFDLLRSNRKCKSIVRKCGMILLRLSVK